MYFFNSNSLEINRILQAFLIVYENEQAYFLSKFYSTMKLSTLRNYVGNLYKDQKLEDFIKKKGWTIENDYVIMKELPRIFEINDLKNNLEFVNSMTILLENNVKANLSLNSFI